MKWPTSRSTQMMESIKERSKTVGKMEKGKFENAGTASHVAACVLIRSTRSVLSL